MILFSIYLSTPHDTYALATLTYFIFSNVVCSSKLLSLCSCCHFCMEYPFLLLYLVNPLAFLEAHVKCDLLNFIFLTFRSLNTQYLELCLKSRRCLISVYEMSNLKSLKIWCGGLVLLMFIWKEISHYSKIYLKSYEYIIF